MLPPPQYIVHSYACVGVQVHVHFHVCVAEMGLAEMSKARSHAVSGGADIALAVGGLQGQCLQVKELWRTHQTHTSSSRCWSAHPLLRSYNWMIPV